MKPYITTFVLAFCFACGTLVAAAATSQGPSDGDKLRSDGPGAGGGYKSVACIDGPGAGGGYLT